MSTPPTTHPGVDWLNSLVNFEKRIPKKYTGEHFDTGRYVGILKALGDPHLGETPTVQILGTDGKGSTLALLESLLHLEGKNTKSFISPHLIRVEERFRRNGTNVPSQELDRCLQVVHGAVGEVEGLTYFEALNAAFWVWVESDPPDFVLLECGLGGRLDTTTICNARLKILTRLERDHFKILGPTMDRIAYEKLAALRGGVHTLIAPQSPHLRSQIDRHLEEGGIPHLWVEDQLQAEIVDRTPTAWTHRLAGKRFPPQEYVLPLLGDHQSQNLSTALLASRFLLGGLPQSEGAIRLSPEWRGRCQIFERGSEAWVLDGSHTAHAGQALRRLLDQLFTDDRPRTFFFTSTRDRFPWCYLRGLVRPEDRLNLVDYPYDRLWKAEELGEKLMAEGWDDFDTPPFDVVPIDQAFLPAAGNGVRIFCGSLYWVGEALRRMETENRASR